MASASKRHCRRRQCEGRPLASSGTHAESRRVHPGSKARRVGPIIPTSRLKRAPAYRFLWPCAMVHGLSPLYCGHPSRPIETFLAVNGDFHRMPHLPRATTTRSCIRALIRSHAHRCSGVPTCSYSNRLVKQRQALEDYRVWRPAAGGLDRSVMFSQVPPIESQPCPCVKRSSSAASSLTQLRRGR
jgi:hypothetical protein